MAKKVRTTDTGFVPDEAEILPLSLFTTMLSVSALCNAQARWLFANLDALSDTGGYAAASDLQTVADVLIAMVEENAEEWQNFLIRMPKGWGHVPWQVKKSSVKEKEDLPF